MECLVDSMKNKEDEECFGAVGPYNGQSADCVEMINATLESNFEVIKARLTFNTRDCLMEKLTTQESYMNKILLTQVLGYSKISWKFWKYFERNSRLTEVKEEMHIFEKEAEEKCRGEDETKRKNDIIETTETENGSETTEDYSEMITEDYSEATTSEDYSEMITEEYRPASTTEAVRIPIKEYDDNNSGDDDEETTQSFHKSVDIYDDDDDYDGDGDGSGSSDYRPILREPREISPKFIHKSHHNNGEDFVFQV